MNWSPLLLEPHQLERWDGVIANTRSPQRGGHIPGATWLEWVSLLNADGTFKSESQVKTLFSEAGLKSEKTAVIYCQTATRSGLVYVGLRAVGHPNIRVYDGSWGEWGNDLELPVET